MKKLVLVVAMFMFVCGGSFLVKAQNSEKAATAQSEVNAAHDQLIKGANIQFQMSPVPNKQRGTTEKDVPYSLSFE